MIVLNYCGFMLQHSKKWQFICLQKAMYFKQFPTSTNIWIVEIYA